MFVAIYIIGMLVSIGLVVWYIKDQEEVPHWIVSSLIWPIIPCIAIPMLLLCGAMKLNKSVQAHRAKKTKLRVAEDSFLEEAELEVNTFLSISQDTEDAKTEHNLHRQGA